MALVAGHPLGLDPKAFQKQGLTLHGIFHGCQISRQRASVLHIEKAAFIPGQVTDAGHQANISLSSKINKPECPRNVCTCFSEAITKISQEKYLVL